MSTKVNNPETVDVKNKKLSMAELYEQFKQEAKDNIKSKNPWNSTTIRDDVNEIFDQLSKEEMVLSIVHKLLKRMKPMYDVKEFTYTVVRSAVMYGKVFELSKDKTSDMTTIVRIK